MARIHTHYDNLKVARNAPPEVIRAAYKTLSQKYHPDRNPGSPDAMRIIQIINSAYETLSDPAKRNAHDEWIAKTEADETKARQEPASAHQPRQPTPGGATHRTSTHHVHRRHHHRPLVVKAFQKLEAMLDQLFKNLLRKFRHAPQTGNGRRR
ncbi:J domain-containing protein [Noviherbaspirillum cavernae]|uniref:J domain-containing protein n=1 Tax=Noviherbaspirillum cavernae TaxID=2320862 RepID=A0A418X2G7_9BURK|nr:J domain-containing protein [Noviherbaspirillum cavernae]